MPGEQRPTVPIRSAAPDGATPATLQLVGGTATGPGSTARNGAATEPLRVLQVRPWDDPNLHRDGHDPRSAYVERFWIAVLGPSAVWLLRLLAREFDELAPGEILRLGPRVHRAATRSSAPRRSPEHVHENHRPLPHVRSGPLRERRCSDCCAGRCRRYRAGCMFACRANCATRSVAGLAPSDIRTFPWAKRGCLRRAC